MPASVAQEIAATAARLIAEEGMEYGPAKRRAAKDLGLARARDAELPSNELLEDEVRSYLALFCADTQPAELAALREVAAAWMQRLVTFRPHLTGAVWRGTATRHSAVHLHLYCDDEKAAEIELINHGVDYDVDSIAGPRGQDVAVLTLAQRSSALAQPVTVHLTILDHDDLRGQLKPDARGRSPRGDLAALRALMAPDGTASDHG
jgi:hypothetical protein